MQKQIHLLATASALVLLMASCSDDPLMKRSENTDAGTMHFDTNIGADASRSAVPKYSRFHAQPIADSDIYLLTGVEDCIEHTTTADDDTDAVTASQGASRAHLLNNDNLGDYYDGRGVDLIAYLYDKNYSSYKEVSEAIDRGEDTGVAEFITGEYLTIHKSDNGGYTLTPQQSHYWVNDDYNMTFFSSFPALRDYREDVHDEVYEASFDTHHPYMQIEVDDKLSEQTDYMIAQFDCKGSGSDNNHVVHLEMKHIMSAISVSLGTGFEGKAIESIKFNNICIAGKYNIVEDEWELDKSDAANMGTRQAEFSISAEGVTSLKDNDNYFMMVPQTLGDDVTITVTVCDRTTLACDEPYTAVIGGTDKVWEQGKTTNYILSTTPDDSRYILEPEFTEMYFSYDGTPAGNNDMYTENGVARDLGNIRVKSYRVTYSEGANGEAIPSYTTVDWTASLDNTGSENIASYPTTSSSYSITPTTDGSWNYAFKVMMKPQSATTIKSSDTSTLENNAAKLQLGSESTPLDLSYYSPKGISYGTRYSSNCYIVNYPGYYEIPIVYGNGIYNDAVNKGAYDLGTSGQSYAMGILKNYNGNNINSQYDDVWIQYHNGKDYHHFPGSDGEQKMEDVFILWQDVDGMVEVTPYAYRRPNSEEFYIRFSISPEKIHPGNAVIKVINDNKVVLWSYHIWVTPYTSADTFTADCNPKGNISQATFLKVPIGYVLEDQIHYPQREAELIIKQQTSNNTAHIKLVQKEHTCSPQSCVYYQWGRKDPFPGAVISETGHLNIDETYKVEHRAKTVYGTQTTTASTTTKIEDGIKNPSVFYTGWRYPDYNYWDLWGCTINSTADTAVGDYPKTDAGSSSRKTVYDPCPIGFKVPPVYAFPAITYDGLNHTAEASPITRVLDNEEDLYDLYINTSYTDHVEFMNSMGFLFYTTKMTGKGGVVGGNTFLLYALGQRYPWDAGFTNVGTHGFYWAATRWTADSGTTNTRGYYFQFGYSDGKSNFEPVFGNTHTNYGFPIMAMVGN
jgi:hypothetical protein